MKSHTKDRKRLTTSFTCSIIFVQISTLYNNNLNFTFDINLYGMFHRECSLCLTMVHREFSFCQTLLEIFRREYGFCQTLIGIIRRRISLPSDIIWDYPSTSVGHFRHRWTLHYKICFYLPKINLMYKYINWVL